MSMKNVTTKVENNFKGLRDQKQNKICDCILDVGTDGNRRSFYVVSALFAMHSDVFRSQLFGSMIESQSQTVPNSDGPLDSDDSNEIKRKYARIEDITPQTCAFIIDLFYGGTPPLTINANIANILYAAKKYILTDLESAVMAFITEGAFANIGALIAMLSEMEKIGLSDEIDSLIKSDTFAQKAEEIIINRHFKLLPKTAVFELLSNDELILDATEESIFEQCINWCKYRSTDSNNAMVSNASNDSSTRKRKLSEIAKDDLSVSQSKRRKIDGSLCENPKMAECETKESESSQNSMQKNDWISLFRQSFVFFIRFAIMDNSYFVRTVRSSGVLTTDEFNEIALYKLDNQCEISFNCNVRRKTGGDKPLLAKKNTRQWIDFRGIQYKILKPGIGDKVIKDGSKVTTFYVGQLENKGIFDKHITGDGFQFTMGQNKAIEGYQIGILGAKQGEKRRLQIPPHLAYGEQGCPPEVPPNETLTFTVEVKNID